MVGHSLNHPDKQGPAAPKNKKKPEQTSGKLSFKFHWLSLENWDLLLQPALALTFESFVLIAMGQSAVAISCLEHLKPTGFFDDIPWLDIPISRRAHFTFEPQIRQRGLLGGSAKGEKMSKLAALAAKRRQNENASRVKAEGDKNTADEHASILKALRISSPGSPPQEPTDITNIRQIDATAARNSSGQLSEDSNRCDLEKQETKLKPQELTALPSAFASTMLGPDVSTRPSSLESTMKLMLNNQPQGFDFTAPSPDDVVTRAQAAKGPR